MCPGITLKNYGHLTYSPIPSHQWSVGFNIMHSSYTCTYLDLNTERSVMHARASAFFLSFSIDPRSLQYLAIYLTVPYRRLLNRLLCQRIGNVAVGYIDPLRYRRTPKLTMHSIARRESRYHCRLRARQRGAAAGAASAATSPARSRSRLRLGSDRPRGHAVSHGTRLERARARAIGNFRYNSARSDDRELKINSDPSGRCGAATVAQVALNTTTHCPVRPSPATLHRHSCTTVTV